MSSGITTYRPSDVHHMPVALQRSLFRGLVALRGALGPERVDPELEQLIERLLALPPQA